MRLQSQSFPTSQLKRMPQHKPRKKQQGRSVKLTRLRLQQDMTTRMLKRKLLQTRKLQEQNIKKPWKPATTLLTQLRKHSQQLLTLRIR